MNALNEIQILRDSARAAMQEADMSRAMELEKRLVGKALKRMKVSERYLDLIHSVLEDPIHGAYKKSFERILGSACSKGVVKFVHSGMRNGSENHVGSSCNSWVEIDANGFELMRLIHGDAWTPGRSDSVRKQH